MSSINDIDATLNSSNIGADGMSETPSTTSVASARVNSAVNNVQKLSEFGTDYNTSTPRSVASTVLSHQLNNINDSMLLIQSESSETNTSQEEVDPKSRLANRTIFKTNNPDLSIIEINANSIKDTDIENSVVVIETSSDDDTESSKKNLKGNNAVAVNASTANIALSSRNHSPNKSQVENAAEKRRRKAESLIHSSKQKLNIAIAEASAAESASPAAVVENILQPMTKREIKIYDCLEEFEKNLPPTVTVLDTPFGSKVYLVGTAHFSEDSQDDVSFVSSNIYRKTNDKNIFNWYITYIYFFIFNISIFFYFLGYS